MVRISQKESKIFYRSPHSLLGLKGLERDSLTRFRVEARSGTPCIESKGLRYPTFLLLLFKGTLTCSNREISQASYGVLYVEDGHHGDGDDSLPVGGCKRNMTSGSVERDLCRPQSRGARGAKAVEWKAAARVVGL
jgi:hypothetical protein